MTNEYIQIAKNIDDAFTYNHLKEATAFIASLMNLNIQDSYSIDLSWNDETKTLSAAVRLKTDGGLQCDTDGLSIVDQYEIHRINATDFSRAWNSDENGEAQNNIKTFGTDPFEKWWGYEFQASPIDAEKLPFDDVLPDYYDGGTVSIQFIFRVADSPAPSPGVYDKVKLGLHAGAYRDNTSINQAYGTIVWATKTITDITRQYFTDPINLTIANIATGLSKIRGKIYRDTSVLQNYNGSIYLDELIITFKKIIDIN